MSLHSNYPAACVRGRDPPRLVSAGAQFLPLWKVIRWRPHAGELRPGPRGPGFFSRDSTARNAVVQRERDPRMRTLRLARQAAVRKRSVTVNDKMQRGYRYRLS